MRCWPYAVVGQSFSIGVAALSGTLAPSFWLWQTITVFGLAFFIAGLSWIATAFIVPKIPEPDDEEVSP